MNIYSRSIALFHEPRGLAFHGAALGYALLGWGIGLAGLMLGNWLVNAAATLLLAHSMVIAAYLVHECAHNLVFRSIRHNARLGRWLTWLCGASYGTYEDIRYKHFRHHVDVDDVVWFDYERYYREHPAILKLTRLLEWFYVPAQELLMHGVMIFTSFIIPRRRDQRRRNLLVILIRGGLFLTLLILFPKAALLYVLAYVLMITVLRFMDSVQHDYGYNTSLYESGRPPRKGNFEWEQAHTFSNPQCFRFEIPNWLTLNFGYHNAHHADMSTPWYRLPARHRELFGDAPENVIPLSAQLKIFHKQRLRRIVGNHQGDEPFGRDYLIAARRGQVYGGNAASFLTSF